MIVEHNQSSFYDNKYKFNGKELDEATGMYYYGARYYDPRISIFVSVDPLAEQFVGWTPYHYVHQNPINLIDPTGMSAENNDGGGWLNRAWNNVKSIFSSSNDPSTTSSPIEHTELDEITINANRKPNWFQRNFSKNKLANDWENMKENSGWNHFVNYKFKGYGSIVHSGQGYDEGAGWDDYEKKYHVLKSTDVSTYSFGKTPTVKELIEGLGKGVSIGEDKNVQEGIKKLQKIILFNPSNKGDTIEVSHEQRKSLIKDQEKNLNYQEYKRFSDSLRREGYYFNAMKIP